MFIRKLPLKIKPNRYLLNNRINYTYFNQQNQRFDPSKDYYEILRVNKNAT